MNNMNSSGSTVLLGKDLQQETGCCAFCGQPSNQLDHFSVSCIDESSIGYRCTMWISKDPKKINACLALFSSLCTVIAVYVILVTREQQQWFFLRSGLIVIAILLLQRFSVWVEIPVPLSHCGMHPGIRKIENKETGYKSTMARFFRNKHSQRLMLGIPIAYMIFVILYAIFVPNSAVFYLKYFIAPVFLTSLSIGLTGGVFRLVISIRRFILSPYGITSAGNVREIWHLAENYCQKAKEASTAREVISESCQATDVGIQVDDPSE